MIVMHTEFKANDCDIKLRRIHTFSIANLEKLSGDPKLAQRAEIGQLESAPGARTISS